MNHKACGGMIKIMTIHGAKGLQSPIVILPETTTMPKASYRFLWQDGLPFFTMRANQYCQFYNNLRDLESKKQYKEYIRLLYVATTRACEQIVFCGHSSSEKINDRCWYHLVESALKDSMEEVKNGDISTFIDQSKILRPKSTTQLTSASSLPLINLSSLPRKLYQSFELFDEANSPLEDNKSSMYGQIVHKIFEDAFQKKNINILVDHHLMQLLPNNYTSSLKLNLQKLVAQDEFNDLFKLDLKTEVSIASDERFGRIDLLAIHSDKVTIIDYKTDSRPPQDLKNVPEKYLSQLAFYKIAIGSIYPDTLIETKILWIMSGEFMTIF